MMKAREITHSAGFLLEIKIKSTKITIRVFHIAAITKIAADIH